MSGSAYFNAGTQATVYERQGAILTRPLYFALPPVTIVAIGAAIPSRIEGGAPMYKKGVAAKVAFKAVDSSGNGVTGLTVTAKTGKDNANPVTTTNSVSEIGQGWYGITLTSTEMNGEIIILDVSASGATLSPTVIHTEPDYTVARAGNLDYIPFIGGRR